MKERIKKLMKVSPTFKKTVGVVLVIVGFLALVTPFTPGSWLIFVGLELLGVRFLVWDRLKAWLARKQ